MNPQHLLSLVSFTLPSSLLRAVGLINLVFSPLPAFHSFFPFFFLPHPSLLLSPLQTMIQLAASCHGTSCLQMSDACVCVSECVCICVAASVITSLMLLHLSNLVLHSDSMPSTAG